MFCTVELPLNQYTISFHAGSVWNPASKLLANIPETLLAGKEFIFNLALIVNEVVWSKSGVVHQSKFACVPVTAVASLFQFIQK